MTSKDSRSPQDIPSSSGTNQEGALLNQATSGTHSPIITGNSGSVSISVPVRDKESKTSGLKTGYLIGGIVSALAALAVAIYTLTGSGQSGSVSQQSSGAFSPTINGNSGEVNINGTLPGNTSSTQTPPAGSP
jgi:hypothetical protein